MDLRPLKTTCGDIGLRGSGGGCPTIYETDDPETLVIQGYVLDPHDLPTDTPQGETLVSIPRELLKGF